MTVRQRIRHATVPAALAMAAAAVLTVTTGPAAHAVGESRKCTIDFRNFGGTVGKNGWNYRTGPSTRYTSRGLLYRGDKLTVMCSHNNWVYTQLSRRSASGLPKGLKGWVRQDGLVGLAG
ncbi:SH3 domain-containing protein [Streptomyces sp. NPDC001621]|uniref:SH3 domain-containing protein n=1 Tax=Streptomyces sp. NPDC001621 TaxID=3364594 RepID=UPI0036A08EDA